MKHIKHYLITTAISLCCFVANAHDFLVDGIYYNITSATDLTVEVTFGGDYSSNYGNEYIGVVTIPSTVTYRSKTYRVTSIGDYAFEYCSSLTSINIPDGLTSIGDRAFYDCSSLTSVTIPENSQLTSIGDHAFRDCSSLTSITIPDGVTGIGIWAFSECSGLTSIDIPESVTSIGSSAFYRCSSLTSISIPENSQLTSIGYGAFLGCSSLTSIDIPESVTSIGRAAFYGCSSLTSISIPENSQLTSIGYGAFSGCSSLTSITIPEGVTSLDRWAFDCSSLTSIVVAEGNTVYDSRDNCNAIIETRTNTLILGCGATIIPNTVLKIGDSAFSGYSSLTSITIPEGVTTIGEEAIAHCDNLTSVYISKSVTEMGEAAFGGNGSLTSIVIDEGNAVYDSRDNCNAIIETSTNTLIQGFPTTVIPNTVRIIGCFAFENYTNLPSIVIPEGVTTIEDGAFEDSNLPSIAIPSSVTSIGDNAFSGCSSLTSITIPEGVTSIGSWAFSACRSLTSITVAEDNAMYDSRETCNAIIETSSNTLICGCSTTVIPEGVTNIGVWAFYGCSSLTSITLPEGVTSIGDYAFYRCSSLTSITIPESVVEIKEWALHSTPWYDNQPDGAIYCGKVLYAYKGTMPANTSIEVKEGTKGIADNAFEYCSNLTSITIPESVMSIGQSVFSRCSSLTSITIPENVMSIGQSVFSRCSSLTSITVEEGNTVYDSRNGCNAIIETGTNTLLAGCSTTIIPESVTSIGEDAFYDCDNLTSITLPESVTSIGEDAFYDCDNLTSITLPKSMTSIESGAFAACSSLTSITCKSITPPVCKSPSPESAGTFEFLDESIPVFVPAASVSAYQTANVWKEFTNIQPLATDYDNTLSIDDMEARSGEQTVLSVNLENVVDITNLQFDLVLPEGITIAQDEDGYELIDLSTERTSARKHTIGNEAQADGSMRILCYSGSNAVFSGTEGEVLTVTLDIDGTVQEGDYTIRMKNLVLTEYTDGNPIKHTVPSVEATISVNAYTPGDVNDDGAIDVTDISGVVNFILNTASDGLLARAADVNDDGAVDVTDISGVVNLILNASATAATSSARDMLRSATTAGGSDIRVTVLPFTLEAGEEKEIYVLLDNPGDAFTGIQLDLHMPEGISVPVDGDGYYYVDLGSRTTSRKHVLPECSVQEDGSLRVLCYSNSNALFSGEEGDVLAITVAGDEDLAGGVYEMALKNIVLSRPDVTNYKPADYALSILSGDAGEETALTLKGIYTKEVLGQFSAALANNSGITSVDLTAGIEVDNTATLTTGNPNTIVYLAEGGALANEVNVVTGDECASLVLTDGYAFAAPVAFSASQASYGRELAEGKYGTIVLPFAPETDDYVFYALTSAGDDVLVFDEVETPAANTPYLYKLRDGKSATQITGNEVAVSSELTLAEAAAWQMVGSYANRTIASGEDGDRYYYAYTSSDNKIHRVTNTLTVKPYRAYFTTSSTGGTQLAIRTRGGEETLIDVTEVDGLCPEVYYDLSGRRVDNPAKGVYIVNGKKVVF